MSGSPTPWVLITGASQGIGEAAAADLARRGWNVLAGVRTAQAAERVRAIDPARIHPVTLDVTDDGSIAAALEEVARATRDAGLRGLVNNAGIVVAAPLEVVPIGDLRTQFDVNVFGLMAVTQRALPSLRRGGGRIVNVSSINGKVAVPFSAPYAASKFALEALSDGLRMELRRWGIPVSVIQPGAIRTAIWRSSIDRASELAGRVGPEGRALYGRVLDRIASRSGEPPSHALPPAAVARVIGEALTARRPRTRYLVGRDARAGALARWLLPDRALDWFLTRGRSKPVARD